MLRRLCTTVLTTVAARTLEGVRPPRRALARADVPRARGRFGLLAAMLVVASGALATSASANSPNPTSVVVNSETFSGSGTTVTISGTWTWDERVPNGPQKDCNDSRIGVGYAIGWGDNTANPLKPHNSTEIIYVGDAEDNWVHSVTQGNQTVDGPFKPSPSKVSESMLGETLDAHNHGFGPQGIPAGTPTAKATKALAEHWVSNCGPTAQSKVDGQTIGNSKPSEPVNGFPNGTWGPISHTYTTPGKHKICPVFYDPHGNHVGGVNANEKEFIAGGTNHNGDNSVESNNNPNPCVVAITLSPEPAFTIEKQQRIGLASGFTTSTLTGEVGQTVEYEIVVKNTGNVPLTFSNFTDAGCEGVAGGPSGALAPEASATYTCEHLITIADQKAGKHENNATDTGTPPEGEGSPITHTSNTVVVRVPEPAFTIEKLQKIEGSGGSFTTSPLSGKLGQVVDYEIIVKNTGNTTLTFSNFSDAKCQGIEGGPTAALAPEASATYTCKHTLTSVGSYVNEATDTGTPPAGEGPPITHTSNKVVVNVPEEPAFTIEKLQRFKGLGGYTKEELTGKLGQTVEYEVVVKNTGNVALKFKALSDSKCEGVSPAGEVEVAVAGEQVYTCSHKLTSVGTYTNEASIEESKGHKEPSNKVVVNVPEEPSFTIEKLQRLKGGGYTKEEITGKLGQTVEYEVVVKNTGNVALKFKALSDAKCEGVSPAGEVEVAVAGEQVYTCSHTLTAVGKYTNEASIEESKGHKEPSNKVVVNVPEEPGFTIEKLQRIGSSSTFTKEELTGKLGQTVEYEVVVKNTGNVALKFKALSDAKCEGASPAGEVEVAVAGEQVYTCSHTLTSVGKYTNEASIEESKGHKEPSNKVVVNVPEEPGFTIKKLQRIGSSSTFTESELTGKLGQTVEYEVVVKNTGNVALKFKTLSDPNCEGVSPAGEVEVAVAGEQTYTCSHKLTSVGKYTNEASIEENHGHKEPSNKVVVNVPAEPAFTIEKTQRIGTTGSFTTSPLTGEVGQTVNYQITVKNTGNTSLTMSSLTDTGCEGIEGGPSKALAPEESATFTCHHVINAADQQAGRHENNGTDTGTPPEGQGSPITHTSNTVVVTVLVTAPHVYLGYADSAENNHGTNTSLPSPWKGSAGVTFEGCGFGGTNSCPKNSSGEDLYDAAAIRIEATTGSGSQEVTAAKVVVGPCTYEPWPGLKATILPGNMLILTQTGKHKCTENALESSNFDTSESFLASPQYKAFKEKGGTCENDGYIPTITLTINGHTVTLKDTGQILTWKGIDPDICTKATEFRNWVQIQ